MFSGLVMLVRFPLEGLSNIPNPRHRNGVSESAWGFDLYLNDGPCHGLKAAGLVRLLTNRTQIVKRDREEIALVGDVYIFGLDGVHKFL